LCDCGPRTVPPSLPDILYLVHRVPYPPDKGDRIRAFHLLRFLASRARVHVACLSDEPIAGPLPGLQRFSTRLAVIPVSRTRWARGLTSLFCGGSVTEGAFVSARLRAIVRQWAAETHFHGCLASSSGMVPYLRLPELRDVPAVIDLVDVDSQKWLDYAATTRGWRSWLYRLEGNRLRRLERDLPSRARAVTLVGEAEAELYRGFCRSGIVQAVTNGVDLDYFHPTPATADPVCVFVGALDYLPNIDGAVWFCREVWPEVLRRQPQARLQLVGRRPGAAVLRLAEVPGVEVVGQVPDVRPHVARAAVVVVPLRIARGVQNKVLEALAMSKATVVSPLARQGLAARPGIELREAATAQDWVREILDLFADADLRLALGSAGRRYVEERHRWNTCLQGFATLLGLPEPCGVAGGYSAEREETVPSGPPPLGDG
jgi:sugar transferase (PEP-CTERM/EpsH1 system associated)